jgi:hypothetical protein
MSVGGFPSSKGEPPPAVIVDRVESINLTALRRGDCCSALDTALRFSDFLFFFINQFSGFVVVGRDESAQLSNWQTIASRHLAMAPILAKVIAVNELREIINSQQRCGAA